MRYTPVSVILQDELEEDVEMEDEETGGRNQGELHCFLVRGESRDGSLLEGWRALRDDPTKRRTRRLVDHVVEERRTAEQRKEGREEERS